MVDFLEHILAEIWYVVGALGFLIGGWMLIRGDRRQRHRGILLMIVSLLVLARGFYHDRDIVGRYGPSGE